MIIPEGVCSSECSNYIYVTDGNKCGLCRDLNTTHKYKLINGTKCLEEIIENSEIYNSELYLLICKSGYILYDNKCVSHCYENCESCSDFSMDISNQKCKTCKEGYSLINENCIEILSTIIRTTIPTTSPIIILTTIPNIMPTTIPINIPTTIPTLNTGGENTIQTIISTKIISTITPVLLPSTTIFDSNNDNYLLPVNNSVINFEYFRNNILNENITSYVNSSNIIKGENFKALISSADDSEYCRNRR